MLTKFNGALCDRAVVICAAVRLLTYSCEESCSPGRRVSSLMVATVPGPGGKTCGAAAVAGAVITTG